MTRAEATGIPFDSSFRALVNPAAAGRFFELHQPRSREAWCAELSRLAYCEDATVIESTLGRVGFTLIEIFDHSGTNGFAAAGDDFSVLCFRGSDNLGSWITNLNAVPSPWRAGGRAHRGFATALEAVWMQVEAAVDRAPRPLVMTGHSLGAALATLAASLRPDAELITFGSPRVGDAAFSESVVRRKGALRRYVNNRDIVCRLPTEHLGYRHVATPHLIDPDGRVLRQIPEEAGLAELLSGALRTGLLFEPDGTLRRELTDHSPINYVSALR
ncbi:MAG: lipase family protein [Rhodospirillales bacterium]|nr:MAG: lipase family protein [Rhodospirillales bacterium]